MIPKGCIFNFFFYFKLFGEKGFCIRKDVDGQKLEFVFRSFHCFSSYGDFYKWIMSSATVIFFFGLSIFLLIYRWVVKYCSNTDAYIFINDTKEIKLNIYINIL